MDKFPATVLNRRILKHTHTHTHTHTHSKEHLSSVIVDPSKPTTKLKIKLADGSKWVMVHHYHNGILFTVYTHSGNWHTHVVRTKWSAMHGNISIFFSLFTEVEDLGEGLETHPPSLFFNSLVFRVVLKFPSGTYKHNIKKKKKETLRAQWSAMGVFL